MRAWTRLTAGLAGLCLAAACTLQTAGAPTGGLTLTATFDDVQSLVAGHSVQISDVRVGSVTDIRLDGYRAKVTMSVEDGIRVPEGTGAVVAKTSILGENYVELTLPEGRDMTSGPFMRSGSTITRTSVEPDIEQVTERAGPLIDALGAQDVNAVLDAAATGLGGKGKDLNRLLRQITEVTTAYAESREDLARTIDGLAELGDDLAKGSEELDRLPGTLTDATARLNHGRKHVKKTLQELTALAREVNSTVYPRHAARLRTLLRELDAVSTSMVRGKEDLKVLISRVQRFIDLPPIVVNGQLLTFVWLKGLLLPKPDRSSDRPRPPNSVDDFRLLLEPPR
ncbi:phospholipid/cholesterol/gamma-HCH transport system substrate-binding protein [Streptosporangium canum]|uniref:Phospholipid/cholesterol/gamma-HCH transport system substrate-binding protein n=1 Tax=Streptosporangium canum TaxID=324952 RepID=A0A1I3N7Q2_9ACTN|nr:MCE family protein [Streptosporangium canum]SFJ05301.1 phospholipid/cholesterol/gamma-HCH transport system substrate-binding protein [Streptosporangium canum]